MTPQDKQLQYERECDAAATAERLSELREAALSGDVELPRATKFIARAFVSVKESLDTALSVKTRGTGGKYKGWLREVGSDAASIIAIRECINMLTAKSRNREKPITVQILAGRIGRLYEMEVKIKTAERVNPMYMQKIHAQVKENATKSTDHLRKLYNVAYDRIMKGELDSTLTEGEIMQLGKFGLQAVMDAGLVNCTHTTGKNGILVFYELDQDVFDILTEYDNKDVNRVVDRGAGAMMCPPIPWTSLEGGGYLSHKRQFEFPLMALQRIRRSERQRIREEFTAEKMPKVFEAGNYLQATPFKLHIPALTAIRRIWEQGGGVMGLPLKNKPTKPAFPLGEDWIKEGAPQAELDQLVAWKREATKHYTALKKWRGHSRELSGFLKVACRHDGPVWFPILMDKRGRWYYNGTPNPQGSDMSKAVLQFDQRKALGSRGLFWLKVSIANCFGFDKLRMHERAQWTDDNWEVIKRALAEPENHPDVFGEDVCDSPWCMYVAAYELNAAYESGNPETYETGIPVHMDATCSGLQHFSAMLRDDVGGKYVNLYDAEFVGPKQDIYSKVATNALEAMKRDLLSDNALIRKYAEFWIATGISRKAAKHPVMTYVYGATLRGTADFLIETVLGDREESKEQGDRNIDYAVYGAKKLFTGIATTVPAAEAAMQWLKQVCRIVPKGKRMEWRTPTGFLVQHDYQDFEETTVYLRSCGVKVCTVFEPLDTTHTTKMQNAIAPNFVHALDASHLTLTVLEMKKKGLHIVGIHDSFGTHPCDVDAMQAATRETFVSLYQNNDVLNDFLWNVGGYGETPMRGSLDLSRVLTSEFFFC